MKREGKKSQLPPNPRSAAATPQMHCWDQFCPTRRCLTGFDDALTGLGRHGQGVGQKDPHLEDQAHGGEEDREEGQEQKKEQERDEEEQEQEEAEAGSVGPAAWPRPGVPPHETHSFRTPLSSAINPRINIIKKGTE